MWDVGPNRPTGIAQIASCKPSAYLRILPKTGPKVPQAGSAQGRRGHLEGLCEEGAAGRGVKWMVVLRRGRTWWA